MEPRPIAIVTGGAGFLGSHISRRLDRTHHVVIIDNMLTGRLENIPGSYHAGGMTLLQKDVIDAEPNSLFRSLSFLKGTTGKIDVIYNFACPASPPKYQIDPVHTMMTNVVGTRNMLELARLTGARVIQASTSEVYGDPQVHPQTESYRGCVNPHGPRSCYDEGKRAAEALCYDYEHKHGVDTRIVRIFNTYGPAMDPVDGRVVTNFIVQAIRGVDITMYGDGSQTRSFCYVDDLIDGIFRLSEYEGKGCHEPFNIGNPDEFSVRQLAHLVIEKTASKSRIVYRDLPIDDPTQRCPNITRAAALLEWKPRVKLDTGLELTISDVKRRRGL